MDCKEVQDNLSAFIDRELSPEAEVSIRTHLGACEQCSAHHSSLLKGWQALDIWEDVTPPGRLRRKVLESVKPQRQVFSIRAVLSVAAVLLLVFGVTVYYLGQKVQSVQDHLAGGQSTVQIAAVGSVSEDEIIANLTIFQESDFLEVLDELVKIDELPLAEEPPGSAKEPERSSLELVFT